MKTKTVISCTTILLVACSTGPVPAQTPVGTAFTYQGQLKQGGLPLSNTADFQFSLWDAAATPPGAQIGTTQSANNVAVTNGLFTVTLDFGAGTFSGNARWLEVSVRSPSGGGSFTTLAPRQELTPAPNAIYAETAGTAVGGVTGSGTNYRIAMFTNGSVIGDSEVYQGSHGNIGVRGAPYFGGILPGWGPDLQVNTGTDLATLWIGGSRQTAGQQVGTLAFVGEGGGIVGPKGYAWMTADIVASTPFPRGGLSIYTADTPQIPTRPAQMRIDPSGYVGIGTNAPVAKLHVAGTAGTDGIMFPDGTLQTTAAGNGGWVDDGSVVRLQTSADQVGIGTLTPGAPLTVIGRVRGAYDTSEAEYVEMAHNGSSAYLNWAGDGGLNLRYNNNTLVTVLQNGNVGLGNATPTSKLDVVGTAEMDGFKMPTGAATGRVLTSDASGVGTWQPTTGSIGGSGTTGYLPKFTAATTLGDSVVYQNGSSIGIGTTSPGEYAKLHVHSDGALIKITNSATGTDYGDGTLLSYFSTGSSDACLWNRENAALIFGTNNTERMRICYNGAMAIGHTGPYCKLDVRSSTDDRVIYAQYTGTGNADYRAFMGYSEPAYGYGIGGDFSGGHYGVIGLGGLNHSTGGVGVYGVGSGNGGTKYGVSGYATGTGTNYGVFGSASGGTNYAGYFDGNVFVAGTINKSACSFKIDHPLAPADKYLYHSVIESPDMKNVYDGIATLDADGTVWVQLPEWFEALNRDFRYQLTCVGGYAPVYVAQEISGNRFQIAGGQPGLKVCWQVTGIRQDAYANAHRLPVEVDKPAEERGKYLDPAAFGLSPDKGVHPQAKAAAHDEISSRNERS